MFNSGYARKSVSFCLTSLHQLAWCRGCKIALVMSELPQSLKGNSKEIKSGHKIQRDNAEQMTSIYIVPKFRLLDTALVRTLQWLLYFLVRIFLVRNNA